MKTKRIPLLSIAIALLFVTGCGANKNALTSTRDAFYVKTEAAPVTNSVPLFAAQDVAEPAKTNAQTGVITPAVPKPGAQPQGVVQVIVQPPPAWEDAAAQQSAKAIGSSIPVYGGLIGLGLTTVFGFGKLWLNRKQKPIIATTFKTLEDFMNAATASGDPKAVALAAKLKENLAKAHDYASVATEVEKLIDAYTGHSGQTVEILKSLQQPETAAN